MPVLSRRRPSASCECDTSVGTYAHARRAYSPPLAADEYAAMTEKLPPVPPVATGDAPDDPARRRLLGGIALAGAALAMGGCKTAANSQAAHIAGGTDGALDAALRKHIRHVLVIYAENRSFNNLFGDFPGLAQPLSALAPERYRQRDRDGGLLDTLPPIWHGLMPHKQVLDGREYQIAEDAIRGLANAPFALATPDGQPLPQALVTRDLIHSFYTNQLQINGGRNDGFVAWGDSGALVMGRYGDSADKLALWQLAKQYTLCDNFFMGAFGGSFLNHQYLVAAQPPFFPHADQGPAKFQITELGGEHDGAALRAGLHQGPEESAAGRSRRPQHAAAAGARHHRRPTQCRGRGLGLVCRRLAAGAGRQGRARYARQLSLRPQLPGTPPAVQLFRGLRARQRRARAAPARRRHRQQRGQQPPLRRHQARHPACGGVLQAAGRPQHACGLFRRGRGRCAHRADRRSTAAEPAVAAHPGGDHRGRERRLVGPRGAAQGRPLG